MAEPVETDVGPASEEGEPQRHVRSEEHTSELQSQSNLVCRLLLEKKKTTLLYKSSPLSITATCLKDHALGVRSRGSVRAGLEGLATPVVRRHTACLACCVARTRCR